MLQKNKPMKRTYFNGLTYAVRAPTDNTLFICAKPEGPAIRVLRFANASRNHKPYKLEDYLRDNDYQEWKG